MHSRRRSLTASSSKEASLIDLPRVSSANESILEPQVPLPIVCAVAANYLVPLLVLVESIKDHLAAPFRPVLYLVHPGLPEELLEWVAEVIELRSIVPQADLIASLPQNTRFPREAAYPLLLAEVLPGELDEVLFLDADMLVLDDLGTLWEEADGDETIAAVADASIVLCGSPRGVKRRSEFGVPAIGGYFNAGVMKIRLEQWRRRDVSGQAFGYLSRAGREVDYHHQEALNAVLWNDWHQLDRRWNLIASLTGRGYSEPDLREVEGAGIVHFAGRFKPWRSRVGGPYAARYRGYLESVARRVDVPPSTWRERALGYYDRNLRDLCYSVERLVWTRRLV